MWYSLPNRCKFQAGFCFESKIVLSAKRFWGLVTLVLCDLFTCICIFGGFVLIYMNHQFYWNDFLGIQRSLSSFPFGDFGLTEDWSSHPIVARILRICILHHLHCWSWMGGNPYIWYDCLFVMD